MFNFNKLRGKIKEHGITERDIAVKIGITPNSMSDKLNGRRPFKVKEIADLCNELSIDKNEIGAYFFAEQVRVSEQSA